MASSMQDFIDHVQRVQDAATEMQVTISSTKQAIVRSQGLLAAAAAADLWPAPPASIRQKFWSDAKGARG